MEMERLLLSPSWGAFEEASLRWLAARIRMVALLVRRMGGNQRAVPLSMVFGDRIRVPTEFPLSGLDLTDVDASFVYRVHSK